MSKCKICGCNTDNVIICLDIDFPVICENCLNMSEDTYNKLTSQQREDIDFRRAIENFFDGIDDE